jgi:hypothetical protein
VKLGALSRALVCFVCAILLTAPAEARFLQVDPVGYKDQINLYQYVGDDPLNHNDPSGNEAGSVTCMYGACDGPQASNLDRQTARAGLIAMGVVYTGGAACAFGGCEALALFGVTRAPTFHALAANLAEGLAPGAGWAGSAAGGLMLAKQLSIEQQLGRLAAGQDLKIIAGPGSTQAFRNAEQVAERYGGKAADWQKVTTNASKTFEDGTRVQVRGFRNEKTGQSVFDKIVQTGGCNTAETRLCK